MYACMYVCMYVCMSHFNCCVGDERFRGCGLHFRLRMLAKPPRRFVHRRLWSFVHRHLWSQPIILILNGVLLDFVTESKGPLPLKRVRQRLEKLTFAYSMTKSSNLREAFYCALCVYLVL